MFTCPECGCTSGHPGDERYGYCGRCHGFTGAGTPPRVMVTGSRSWRDADAIYARLAQLDPDTVVVHGACKRGADAMADDAAIRLGLARQRFPARWGVGASFNPRAGFERNDVMLDSQPRLALVLAFRWHGVSNGTDHAVRGAQQRGLPLEVNHPAPIGTRR